MIIEDAALALPGRVSAGRAAAAEPMRRGQAGVPPRNCDHAEDSIEQALARRVEEQAALFEFSERLQRATDMLEVCTAGLGAIRRLLRCDRAAILLRDEAGVMRFIAAEGLSEAYCRAAEGHSPWPPESAERPPICLDDAAASDLPPALKAALADEGIDGLAFIPLEETGRLLGKFMAYWNGPTTVSPAALGAAMTLGRQLGFGISRLHTEAARRQGELAAQRLAAIVESSDDAIISKDLDGVITSWNAGAERVFGYTAAEAIGQPVTMLMPPDRLDEEPGILRRIRAGERIDHYETIRRRKDGRLIDISLTVSPMRDVQGRVFGASKIARDITDRKRAERQIRDSERRLQELMAAIPAAIYTTDAGGRITYFNEAAVALAGRRPVIGTDDWCITWKLYRPDRSELPHADCPMAVALREQRAIRDSEVVAERPDGTRIPVIPYPTPLYDAEGRLTGAINMLVDISERKQAETQQRLLLNELNHRVKNNMQMLQSLLLTAAHETPNVEARRILGEAGKRLAAMAAAQRVLYGTVKATEFSAPDFLTAVCETVRQTFPEEIAVVCDADAVELSNDAAMPLALILNELLINAVKHGLKGRAEGHIKVSLRRAGDGHQLCVEDEGPGFDLAEIGTGSSGLRLVRGLARQLRGSFQVTRGATTRCCLSFC
jgi:PAS domain S-box-containing protein